MGTWASVSGLGFRVQGLGFRGAWASVSGLVAEHSGLLVGGGRLEGPWVVERQGWRCAIGC